MGSWWTDCISWQGCQWCLVPGSQRLLPSNADWNERGIKNSISIKSLFSIFEKSCCLAEHFQGENSIIKDCVFFTKEIGGSDTCDSMIYKLSQFTITPVD